MSRRNLLPVLVSASLLLALLVTFYVLLISFLVLFVTHYSRVTCYSSFFTFYSKQVTFFTGYLLLSTRYLLFLVKLFSVFYKNFFTLSKICSRYFYAAFCLTLKINDAYGAYENICHKTISQTCDNFHTKQ